MHSFSDHHWQSLHIEFNAKTAGTRLSLFVMSHCAQPHVTHKNSLASLFVLKQTIVRLLSLNALARSALLDHRDYHNAGVIPR